MGGKDGYADEHEAMALFICIATSPGNTWRRIKLSACQPIMAINPSAVDTAPGTPMQGLKVACVTLFGFIAYN
jgi:hypothetical protein